MNDELRDLIERTTQVQEMSGTQGWALLADRANVTIGAKQRQLLGGKVIDLNEYKELIGFINGALSVLGLPKRMQEEMLAKIEEDGDAA